ncbi:MAG: right-handed parallel beta-helix repeat-containing protein [Calditrichota bacterium]
MLIGGCKKDDPQSDLSGRVNISGASAADAIIEVYDVPNISDDVLWNRMNEYTAVGFPYIPNAVFEWRASASSRRAQTSAGEDGSFKISELPEGDYFVIVRKPHYGWSEPISANMRGQSLDIGTITLFPEDTIQSGTFITENTVWRSKRHYVVELNVYINNDVKLTVEPGAVVRMGDGGRIFVLGELAAEGTPESFIKFTSDNQTNPSDLDWQRINFDVAAAPPLFRYCTFNFCESGILSATGGGIVENCYFNRIGGYAMDLSGSQAAAGDSVIVRRNVINGIPFGMRIVQVNETGMAIEKNALFNCSSFGIDINTVYGGSIYCNWFFNCGRNDTLPGPETGVTSLMGMRNVEIYRNVFELSWYALALGSRVDSSVHIHSNRFIRLNRVMNVGVTNDGAGPSFPTFYSNCLENCAGYFIFVESCHVNNIPINATGNYWGTLSSSTIENRFNDCRNDPECPCIEYQPFLTSCPLSVVGICED